MNKSVEAAVALLNGVNENTVLNDAAVKRIKVTYKQCGEYDGQIVLPEIEVEYHEPSH